MTTIVFFPLNLRNGGFRSSPLIGQFCGSTIPANIRSDSNRMYIKFRSDGSDSQKGFRLTYDATLSGQSQYPSHPHIHEVHLNGQTCTVRHSYCILIIYLKSWVKNVRFK